MNWLTEFFLKCIPKKHLKNSNSGKTFDEMYEDLGVFSYNNDGFTITYEDFTKTLQWDNITQLNVYKVDLMTIDQIEMEIVYGEKCFLISEELPGWYQFVFMIKEVFPTIQKDWDVEIVFPAFARNYKTIYDRLNSPLFFTNGAEIPS